MKNAGLLLLAVGVALSAAFGARLAPGMRAQTAEQGRAALLEEDRLWTAKGEEAWTVVHAAILLGAIGGPGVMEPLLGALRRAEQHERLFIVYWGEAQ